MSEKEDLAAVLHLAVQSLGGPTATTGCAGGCRRLADAVIAAGWTSPQRLQREMKARQENLQGLAEALQDRDEARTALRRIRTLVRDALWYDLLRPTEQTPPVPTGSYGGPSGDASSGWRLPIRWLRRLSGRGVHQQRQGAS